MSEIQSWACSTGAAGGRPSHRAAGRGPAVLHLYRARYQGFNVRHFSTSTRRDHDVTLSYTFVKLALQAAGLVPKGAPAAAIAAAASPGLASASSCT
jgi:hypothetical protein